jgi:hypothetical protein
MAKGESSLFPGVYRGVCVNNKDPEGHRRIKLTVPQLTDGAVSNWAWPKENSGVKTEVPTIGEGVFVMFEGGHPSYPIWIGTYGKHKTGKKVNIKTLSDSTSLTGLDGTHIITERTTNGTTEVDLVATILAMANKIKALETNITALHATLATRTTSGHTHTTAG